VAPGSVTEVVRRVAMEQGADLVVIGRHEGKVYDMVRESPCPVVSVVIWRWGIPILPHNYRIRSMRGRRQAGRLATRGLRGRRRPPSRPGRLRWPARCCDNRGACRTATAKDRSIQTVTAKVMKPESGGAIPRIDSIAWCGSEACGTQELAPIGAGLGFGEESARSTQ